jgi:hypothetical protein
MYSALYRIEYEKFTNEASRQEWEHYWNLVLLMMETQENTLRYKSKESGTKTNDLNADTILNGFNTWARPVR